MTKKNIMPVAVLTVICVVVAILLAVVNYFTAPEIKKNADRKVNESLYAVLDEAEGFDNVKLEDYASKPETVQSAYKDKGGNGYVIVLETSTSYTSGAKMSITVGIGTDGAIKGAKITQYSETKDFGKETYPNTFVGLTSEDIDTSNKELLVSGVTYSSKAFKAAVKDALDFAAILGGAAPVEPEPEVLPKTDAEIIALANALVGSGADLEDVTPDERDLVKRVYKDKGGKGYVAYLVVISPDYGTVETETLVHFTSSGKIAGVNKLTWKTSDAIYGYVPPTEDVVDAFYAKLKDNNSASFKEKFTGEGVELVSNATSTSTRLVNSITEAFEIVDSLVVNDMPTDETTVKSLAAALVGEGADLETVEIGTNEYVRRLYRDKGGKGYVAYAVVISQYGTPETETLIYTDNDGKIAGVKKITWKTSDAMYGYVPPTEDVVDAFYAKLPGNDLASIESNFTGEGVELVANATSTSTKLVSSIIESLEIIEEAIGTGEELPDTPADTTPRMVGIIILAVAFASVVAVIVIKYARRRRV